MADEFRMTVPNGGEYWSLKLREMGHSEPIFPAFVGELGAARGTLSVSLPSVREAELVGLSGLLVLLWKYWPKHQLVVARPSADGSVLLHRWIADGTTTCAAFLEQTRDELAACGAQRGYPFEALCRDLGWSLTEASRSLCQVGYALDEEGAAPLPFEVPFFVRLRPTASALLAEFTYDGQVLSSRLVAQLARHYVSLVRTLAQGGALTLAELSVGDATDLERVLDAFQAKRIERARMTLHQLVAHQAAVQPDATAIIFRKRRTTYGALVRKASAMAAYLRQRSIVQPGQLVGIIAGRSEKPIIAMLGVLECGAAYVPIDARQPWWVIHQMLQTAGVSALIVDTDALALVQPFEGPLFVLDVELDALPSDPQPEGERVDDTALAYVIHTSGSSGAPKGVAVEHRAIVNSVLWRIEHYSLVPRDVTLLLPSFAFDSSVLDIWATLAAGGAVAVPEGDLTLDAKYLTALIDEVRASRWTITPAYYRALLEALAPTHPVSSVTVAGERTSTELVRQHYARLPGVPLYNEYGPTENAVCSTAARLDPGCDTVPIGRPITNVQVLILDGLLRPLPPGAIGEIYLSGAGLARGYVGQPQLTRERFPESAVPTGALRRFYKTGDLGAWSLDGELEFFGRADGQVKIRGYRIELGHVEQVLKAHPSVRDAAALRKTWADGEPYLAAYVVLDRGMDTQSLSVHLSQRMPFYMTPDVLVRLERLPINRNGKLDLNQLRNINDAPPPRLSAVPDLPAAALEGDLLNVCAELFKRPDLGSSEDLFDLGASSLKIMDLVTRIRVRLALEVGLQDVYTHPTVKGLAACLGSRETARREGGTVP